MIEKFSDYEGTQYLSEEGEFEFSVTSYELKDGANGPVAHLGVKCDKGITTLYHSLNPKARWSYNGLIKACLHLDTKEKIENFELDYETVGNQLVGTKFKGVVEADLYKKEIKVAQPDGTFTTDFEQRTSYKVVKYSAC